MEAGQQSDDAGRCLPSTVIIRSGRCPGVKGGAFGGGFAQALAGQAEAMGVVHEAVEDGVGDGWIGDHLVPMLHTDLAGDDGRAREDVAAVERRNSFPSPGCLRWSGITVAKPPGAVASAAIRRILEIATNCSSPTSCCLQ